MGRKRKKKENSLKKSLVFEESPVEGLWCALSPVACAENPVTALSVAINSDTNVSWISPQFNGATATGGKRRQTRRHRGKSSNNSSKKPGSGGDKENSRAGRTNKRFPALRFLGDPAEKGAGRGGLRRREAGRVQKGYPVEGRVSIEREGETEDGRHISREQAGGRDVNEVLDPAEIGAGQDRCCSVNENSGPAGTGGYDHISVNKIHCPPGSASNDHLGVREVHDPAKVAASKEYHCVETVRRRLSRRSVAQTHRPSLACPSAAWDTETDSPASSPDVTAARHRPGRSAHPVTRGRVRTLGADGGVEQDTDLVCDRHERKAHNSGILLSPCQTSDVQCEGAHTPSFAGFNLLSLRTALFSGSPSDDTDPERATRNPAPFISSPPHSDHLCSSPPPAKKNCATELNTDDERGLRRRNSSGGQKGGTPGQAGGCPKDGQRRRRSGRLREQVLRSLQSKTPCKTARGQLLVTDTPEDQYHLTVRQRQLLKTRPL